MNEGKKIIENISPDDFQGFTDMSAIANSDEVIERDGKTITGLDAIAWLIAHYSGGRVYIPNPKSVSSLIIKYLKNNRGCTPRQLASRIGMSETKIREILKIDRNENQEQLFGE